MQLNKFNPKDFIGYLLKSAGQSFTNRVNKKIKEHGFLLTIEQVGIVFRLYYFEGATQRDLAEFFCKDKTTITRTVNAMEKNNLLVRIPSNNDKRVNLLYLTSKGKELQSIFAKIALSTSKEALKNIDEAELETTKKVLSKIKENLDKIK
ncbi:MAG: DNA-binding MarR family transcriptional regulator [Saprospiraceae bacterium]|jgi:DNA-binding MarR family transcriptional regulator